MGPGGTEIDVSGVSEGGDDEDDDDGVLPVSVVGDYVTVTVVGGSVRIVGYYELGQGVFAPGDPFAVEAEIDGEADEGGEVEDEDCEAYEEGRAAALAGKLDVLGVESHGFGGGFSVMGVRS